MENKKNILCKSELSNDENLYTLYNIMCNLFLCDPEYVVYVFDIIKRKSDNDNFNNFLKYFETEYIKRYGITVTHVYRAPKDYNATCDVLEWNDPRRIVQIPYNAIDAGYPSTDRAIDSNNNGDLRWKSYSVAQ